MNYLKFDRKIEGIIRNCRKSDLHHLLWFGMFYEHKEIIEDAFEKHLKGDLLFMVCEFNDFPVGQLWVDYKKSIMPETGHLWAFRVLDPFQGMGIGSRMLKSAENLLLSKGFKYSELGVEKSNPRAKTLYEKFGYVTYKEETEVTNYTNPDGVKIEYKSEQWMLIKRLVPDD
jgi:ribosomal protein S18 acetylase RimI-like enzyme